MNCWEYMKCGREKGGLKAEEFGACPAFPVYGKHCARVAGTICGGKVQGSSAIKHNNCLICRFYNSPFYDRTYSLKCIRAS